MVKWLEHPTVDREAGGSILPPSFRSLGNFVHPILTVSFGRDTETVGPFYLVSRQGEVKIPHRQAGCRPTAFILTPSMGINQYMDGEGHRATSSIWMEKDIVPPVVYGWRRTSCHQ